MNRIKFLQTKKLFKELDYIQSDYDYKNEVINEADIKFIENIELFLNNYPELKELYVEHTNYEINDSLSQGYNILLESEEEEDYIDKDQNLKKIYREIVKITHPDIIIDKSMNEYYIDATNFYENNDIVGIYKICIELGIVKYLDLIDNELIEDHIEILKKRTIFLENNLTWSWINSNNEKDKQEILIKYIQDRLQ